MGSILPPPSVQRLPLPGSAASGRRIPPSAAILSALGATQALRDFGLKAGKVSAWPKIIKIRRCYRRFPTCGLFSPAAPGWARVGDMRHLMEMRLNPDEGLATPLTMLAGPGKDHLNLRGSPTGLWRLGSFPCQIEKNPIPKFGLPRWTRGLSHKIFRRNFKWTDGN